MRKFEKVVETKTVKVVEISYDEFKEIASTIAAELAADDGMKFGPVVGLTAVLMSTKLCAGIAEALFDEKKEGDE